MNFEQYIKEVLKTESKGDQVTDAFHMDKSIVHAAIGLSTEANEILDNIKKHIFYGKPLDRVNLVEESGDLLWYLAILIYYAGLPLFDSILDMNVEKLRKRYGEKFDNKKAVNRDVKNELNHIEVENKKNK